MKIYNTKEQTGNIPIFMLLYGEGGIGKSTFAATAPGVFMADCEGGAKFFGRRGINVVVANIETWADFAAKDGFVDMAIKNEKVQTIVVDPIGELMEKCKRGLTGSGLTTADGQPTMRGWGEMGNRMGTQLRKLRDAGKNVILVAHVDEKDDEGRLVKRPLIQTKLAKIIPNMVDLVGYMHGTLDEDGKQQRVISFDSTDDKIEAKDRTDALDPTMPPSFPLIQERINNYVKPEKPEGEDEAEIEADSFQTVASEDSGEGGDSVGDEPTETDTKAEKMASARKKLKAMNAETEEPNGE